jgi:hypothetical protein
MTKKEAQDEFKKLWKAQRMHRHDDRIAKCSEWGYYIDGLCKDRQITDKQYATWPRKEMTA